MVQTFALVKWLGGVDHGKYTANVPIEWIKDFDLDTFSEEEAAEDSDISYVIEWREGRKKPRGGWKVFDGYVKAVNGMFCLVSFEFIIFFLIVCFV